MLEIRNIKKSYKNMEDDFKYEETGFELVGRITREIEEKNIKEGKEREEGGGEEEEGGRREIEKRGGGAQEEK